MGSDKRFTYALVILATIALASIGMAGYFLTQPSPARSVASSMVTIEGKIICLSHKNTASPSTLTCATGLQTSDNRNYILTKLTPLPTNTTVKVRGVLTPALSNTVYDIAGSIEVIAFQKK